MKNLLDRYLKNEKPCIYWARGPVLYHPSCPKAPMFIPKKYMIEHQLNRCPYCYKPIYIMDFL